MAGRSGRRAGVVGFRLWVVRPGTASFYILIFQLTGRLAMQGAQDPPSARFDTRLHVYMVLLAFYKLISVGTVSKSMSSHWNSALRKLRCRYKG